MSSKHTTSVPSPSAESSASPGSVWIQLVMLIPFGCGGGFLAVGLAVLGLNPVDHWSQRLNEQQDVAESVETDVPADAPHEPATMIQTVELVQNQSAAEETEEESPNAAELEDNVQEVPTQVVSQEPVAEDSLWHRVTQRTESRDTPFNFSHPGYRRPRQNYYQQAHQAAQQDANRFMQDYQNSMSGTAGALGLGF